jgi:acetamidase/formamidase
VNPVTGPFYVEGAEPGDVLSVRFDSLKPNRRFGWSGVQLAYKVVCKMSKAVLSKLKTASPLT